MLNLLVTLLIFILVAGLVYWVLGQVALPTPLKTGVTIVLAIVGVLYLVALLTGTAGVPVLRL